MFPISDADVKAQRVPVVNVALIVICVGVFIYELTIGVEGRFLLFYKFGLIPVEMAQGESFSTLQTPFGVFDITSPIPLWATLFTSMFIHGSILHIVGNLLFLWVFGDNVEDRLGHFWYLIFYLAAGSAAAGLQIAMDTLSQQPTIGASGAIAGVLGAYLVLYPYSRVNTAVVLFFIFIIRIPALALLGFWFMLQFVSGIGSLGPSAQSSGIAYWAHVGGFILGVTVIAFYRIISRGSPPKTDGISPLTPEGPLPPPLTPPPAQG